MRSSRKIMLALALAGTTLLVASPASAQSSGVLSTSWRQQDRADAMDTARSSQLFAFELRMGPYYPQVDSEFGGKAGPYTEMFGKNPRFYFGLEFDFLPFRIPYVGVIGPGLGWGYTAAWGYAKFIKGPSAGKDSGEATSLAIMPMHLSVVLRADELMRRTRVPIVPYAKFGAGFALWKASDGSGRSEVTQGDLLYTGAGNTAGLHLALGGALSLNFIDPRSSARLDESTGINHIYLFAEWMNAMLNGFGASRSMHVGTSTVVGGLSMDM